jgi:hypothetical protein
MVPVSPLKGPMHMVFHELGPEGDDRWNALSLRCRQFHRHFSREDGGATPLFDTRPGLAYGKAHCMPDES